MRSVWDGFAHPARIVPLAFLAAIVVGTVLLSLPYSTPGPTRPPVLTAAFTTVSAVCVTGLTTVDTATYWSPFGQAVILALIQVGGFGIMTLATLLGPAGRRQAAASRRSLIAQAETQHPQHRRRAARGAPGRDHHARLRGRRRRRADRTVPAPPTTTRGREAAWHGVFHSVSAFNNAGFALYSDNLIGFVGDAWIMLPDLRRRSSSAASGFPVLFELRRALAHARDRGPCTPGSPSTAPLILLAGRHRRVPRSSNGPTPAPSARCRPWGKVVGGVTGGVDAPHRRVQQHRLRRRSRPRRMAVTYVLMFIGGG